MPSDNKTKNSRTDLIVSVQELLKREMVGTQQEIKEALEKQGFIINQVKISRILNKLGAIKIHENDRIVYRLPTELISIAPKDTLKQLILNIAYNETLIVIQTVPGSAQLLARLLDQKNDIGVLGTVAGDDTIFIAPQSVKEIKSVFQKINLWLLD